MVSDAKLAVALVCVMLFNTAALGFITYKGAEYRKALRAREGLWIAVGVLSGLAPPEEVVGVAKSIGGLMDAIAGDFLLGSTNGSIPAFLQNTLTAPFGDIATDVGKFAAKIAGEFSNVTCGTVLCERADQVVNCGGSKQYCSAKGEYIKCKPSAGCLPQYLASASLAVKSVTDRIEKLRRINATAGTPPAFSSGIFRLDVVLTWFAAQFDFNSWHDAAQVASNFVANVRRVDFSGCVLDRKNERTKCWNLNPAVTTVLNTINQVSGVLAPATN